MMKLLFRSVMNDSGCFISLDFFSDNLEKKNLHKILNKKRKRLCIFNKTIKKLGIAKITNLVNKILKNTILLTIEKKIFNFSEPIN